LLKALLPLTPVDYLTSTRLIAEVRVKKRGKRERVNYR
jgi:hypothetical protein